jgi:hypothetical protein
MKKTKVEQGPELNKSNLSELIKSSYFHVLTNKIIGAILEKFKESLSIIVNTDYDPMDDCYYTTVELWFGEHLISSNQTSLRLPNSGRE